MHLSSPSVNFIRTQEGGVEHGDYYGFNNHFACCKRTGSYRNCSSAATDNLEENYHKGELEIKTMEGKLALATKISAGVFTVCALLIAMLA